MTDWPFESGSFPPGHYHSPVPSIEEIRADQERLFDLTNRELPGIDLDEAGQLELLERIAAFYPELPFEQHATPERRYYFENPVYSWADAIFLYGMIRWIAPKRIIEIGSGFSSAVMLDTNELFFDSSIKCTFIEPYPDRLHQLLREGDFASTTVHQQRLQDVDTKVFSSLSAGDILFIDSSHVSKVGSDLNQIIFEILPALPAGVYIHFHDLFYPFEYPQEWIVEHGRIWNEAYLLRAFLECNPSFRIRIWNHYLAVIHKDRLQELMPLCSRNPGGSIWLQRV
jgi:hypothetical protein